MDFNKKRRYLNEEEQLNVFSSKTDIFGQIKKILNNNYSSKVSDILNKRHNHFGNILGGKSLKDIELKKFLKSSKFKAILLSSTLAFGGFCAKSIYPGENGLNQRIYSSSYDGFLEENLEKYKNSFEKKGFTLEFPDKISCSKAIISKDENLPYECPPFISYSKKGDLEDVVYLNKKFDSEEKGKIISIREMIEKNLHLYKDFFRDFENDAVEKERIIKGLIYSIYSITKDEYLLKGVGVNEIRTLPTFPGFDSMSKSAMRVKVSSIKDYTEEEQKEMLENLATFKIIPADRERGLLYWGQLEDLEYDENGYIEIYKLYGYEDKEEFKKDFLDGKIKTNGEVGFAMGVVISAKIKEKTFVSEDDVKNLKKTLESQGINIDSSRFIRSVYLLNRDYVDLSEKSHRIFSRVSNLYPTNVNKSIASSKKQTFGNIAILNNFSSGENSFLKVDGDAGKMTNEKLRELGLFSENGELDIVKIEQEFEKYNKNMYEISKKYAELNKKLDENKGQNLEIDEKDRKYFYYSMVKNHDSIYNAYSTINYFLSEQIKDISGKNSNKIDETRKEKIEKMFKDLNKAYNDYIENRKTEKLFEIFEIFTELKNIREYTPLYRNNFAPNLIGQDIIITNLLKEKGYSVDLFNEGGVGKNKTNTLARGNEKK